MSKASTAHTTWAKLARTSKDSEPTPTLQSRQSCTGAQPPRLAGSTNHFLLMAVLHSKCHLPAPAGPPSALHAAKNTQCCPGSEDSRRSCCTALGAAPSSCPHSLASALYMATQAPEPGLYVSNRHPGSLPHCCLFLRHPWLRATVSQASPRPPAGSSGSQATVLPTP